MGNLSKVDWSLVSSAAEELSELPIFIDDSPDDSIRDYRIRCKLLRRDCPNFGLIFWDRILPPYEHGKPLEEILGTLQDLAKLAHELGVPVVATVRFAASRLPQSFADLPDLLSVADVIMVADDAGLLRVIHNSWGECGTVDVPHLVFTATEVTDAIERSRDLPL